MRSARRLLLAVLILFLNPSRSAPISVPFQITSKGLIEVICEMQSKPGKVLSCIIDTGAQNSMAAVSSVSSESVHGAPTVGFLTAAGRQIAYLTKQTILLGGVPIPATVEVTPTVGAMGTDVLIGEDVLSQFQSFRIDYTNHVLTYEIKQR